MGLLKIHGSIRLEQFWPRGKSEADASKIKITIGDNSFQFSPHGNDDFKPVNLFNEAFVGQGRKKQKVLKRGNQIVARLQGADAPELHYNLWGPTPTKHPTRRGSLDVYDYEQLITINNTYEFRQPLAETASVKLIELLAKTAKGGQVPCTFLSQVQSPQDVCDAYGRFVGDVWIEQKSRKINLNHWLLEKGWAFPALYNSMSVDEISAVIEAAGKGKASKGSAYNAYREYLGLFNYDLLYRDPSFTDSSSYSFAQDKGHLIYPKLFRRWCIYHIYKLAKVDIGIFGEFLKACDDEYYATEDFIKSSKGKKIEPKKLFEAVRGNRLTLSPLDMVFIEKPSSLIDSKGDEINTWE